MTTLLQINASIHQKTGQSSVLADRFVAAYRASHPDTQVVVRDVAAAGIGAGHVANPAPRRVDRRETSHD